MGTLIVALTAWYAAASGIAAPYRLIYIVAALPALIGIFLRLWVPESPMFLIRTGRADEARQVLDRVRAANGVAPMRADAVLTTPLSGNTPLLHRQCSTSRVRRRNGPVSVRRMGRRARRAVPPRRRQRSAPTSPRG